MLKRISDGMRNGTFGKEMQKLGYSKTYSEHPSYLKDTDSWQALLEEQLPDELLMKVHKGLLKHKDWRARDSGLDKGYKIKRKYDNTITLKYRIAQLSDSDIEEELARIVSEVSAGRRITEGIRKKKSK